MCQNGSFLCLMFFSEITRPVETKLVWNVHLMVLYKLYFLWIGISQKKQESKRCQNGHLNQIRIPVNHSGKQKIKTVKIPPYLTHVRQQKILIVTYYIRHIFYIIIHIHCTTFNIFPFRPIFNFSITPFASVKGFTEIGKYTK